VSAPTASSEVRPARGAAAALRRPSRRGLDRRRRESSARSRRVARYGGQLLRSGVAAQRRRRCVQEGCGSAGVVARRRARLRCTRGRHFYAAIALSVLCCRSSVRGGGADAARARECWSGCCARGERRAFCSRGVRSALARRALMRPALRRGAGARFEAVEERGGGAGAQCELGMLVVVCDALCCRVAVRAACARSRRRSRGQLSACTSLPGRWVAVTLCLYATALASERGHGRCSGAPAAPRLRRGQPAGCCSCVDVAGGVTAARTPWRGRVTLLVLLLWCGRYADPAAGRRGTRAGEVARR
jgi:hypothetical protein